MAHRTREVVGIHAANAGRVSFPRSLSAVALVCVALGAAPSAAAGRRGPIPEDLVRLRFISGAHISHDGKRVAFVVQTLDAHANRTRANIWVVSAAGGPPWQLTRGDSDDDPQWSADDRTLAFTRGREQKQIYRIALAGGEAWQLTRAEHGASDPRWSHDGTRILYSATSVDEQPATALDEKAAGFTLPSKWKKSDVRRIDRLDFELNGSGYIYNKHSHLYVMRADGSHQMRITPRSRYDDKNAVWSRDDRAVAFNSLRRFDPYRFGDDLYVVAAGGGTIRQIRTGYPFSESPQWLRRANVLAFGISKSADPAEQQGIGVIAAAGGSTRVVVPINRFTIGDAVLSDTKEGGPGCGPLAAPDDRSVLSVISVHGATSLVRFDLATGGATTVVSRGDELAECSDDLRQRHVAFVASDARHPGEVWIADLASGAQKRLTGLNDGYLRSVWLSTPQRFSVIDDRGFYVEAWFMPALGAPRGAPTLLEIHGGPQTLFGNTYFHEMQMLAARGYNVVFANPRGSLGYGYAFIAALNKAWGPPMFDDEMRVMDAVARRPGVDPARFGVLGGSYGGYATLWVIAQTDRFKAAISERPVSNLAGSSINYDFSAKADPRYTYPDMWDDVEANYAHSPVAFVDRVHTPLLIVHGDDDLRTPVSEARQEYKALKALERDVTYVEFPDENHDLNRTGSPIHRIERLHIFADWLDGKLK